ncbi:helix-turn-helix transcriptional regulator [Salinirubrum litoreum]|uniref:Helix-turn-helix transcriptional regulator n=1 Tax=Salinirubrum litoreum TaxID=1126234 RepID=A0ABD5RE24_9EURY|nr:hypothetical protein [Salinirubrum litoreum]
MRYAALIVALLTLSVGVAPALAVSGVGDTPVAPTPGQSASLDDTPGVVGSTVLQTDGGNETPRTTITIDLRANTSARWTITTRQSLDGEDEREAFRDLVAEFEAGGAGVDADVATFRNYARQAENYTGRQMAIERVDPTGSIDETGETGILNLTFTWTNFAERTESDRLRVRDAFLRAEGESWFPRLTGDQRLVIHGPDDFNTYTTPSAARQQGNTVIFDSGQELDPETVYATFQPEPPAPPSLVEQLLGMLGSPVALGAILLVAVVGAVAFVRYRRDDSPPPAGSESSATDAETESAQPTDAAAGAGAAAAGTDESADAEGDTADEEDEIDLELLSDEERVEHLLEQNGGRMKQASIVKETGWSDAKVSQLLSAMAEEDRINKLRLGRENLISLPDEDDPV